MRSPAINKWGQAPFFPEKVPVPAFTPALGLQTRRDCPGPIFIFYRYLWGIGDFDFSRYLI